MNCPPSQTCQLYMVSYGTALTSIKGEPKYYSMESENKDNLKSVF